MIAIFEGTLKNMTNSHFMNTQSFNEGGHFEKENPVIVYLICSWKRVREWESWKDQKTYDEKLNLRLTAPRGINPFQEHPFTSFEPFQLMPVPMVFSSTLSSEMGRYLKHIPSFMSSYFISSLCVCVHAWVPNISWSGQIPRLNLKAVCQPPLHNRTKKRVITRCR